MVDKKLGLLFYFGLQKIPQTFFKKQAPLTFIIIRNSENALLVVPQSIHKGNIINMTGLFYHLVV